MNFQKAAALLLTAFLAPSALASKHDRECKLHLIEPVESASAPVSFETSFVRNGPAGKAVSVTVLNGAVYRLTDTVTPLGKIVTKAEHIVVTLSVSRPVGQIRSAVAIPNSHHGDVFLLLSEAGELFSASPSEVGFLARPIVFPPLGELERVTQVKLFTQKKFSSDRYQNIAFMETSLFVATNEGRLFRTLIDVRGGTIRLNQWISVPAPFVRGFFPIASNRVVTLDDGGSIFISEGQRLDWRANLGVVPNSFSGVFPQLAVREPTDLTGLTAWYTANDRLYYWRTGDEEPTRVKLPANCRALAVTADSLAVSPDESSSVMVPREGGWHERALVLTVEGKGENLVYRIRMLTPKGWRVGEWIVQPAVVAQSENIQDVAEVFAELEAAIVGRLRVVWDTQHTYHRFDQRIPPTEIYRANMRRLKLREEIAAKQEDERSHLNALLEKLRTRGMDESALVLILEAIGSQPQLRRTAGRADLDSMATALTLQAHGAMTRIAQNQGLQKVVVGMAQAYGLFYTEFVQYLRRSLARGTVPHDSSFGLFLQGALMDLDPLREITSTGEIRQFLAGFASGN